MGNRRINKALSILLLTIFFALGLMVRNSSEGILFDLVVLEYIHSATNPVVLSIMKSISFIGSGYFLVPILAIIIVYSLIKKRYYITKLLLASTLGSWVFNYILKFVFQRTRPLNYFLVEQGGLSYPSGHSMVTMSMYLTITYLLIRNEKLIPKKKIIYTASIIFILLMGISRMYLGVHWPTDIIGGFIMGYIYFQVTVATIKE